MRTILSLFVFFAAFQSFADSLLTTEFKKFMNREAVVDPVNKRPAILLFFKDNQRIWDNRTIPDFQAKCARSAIEALRSEKVQSVLKRNQIYVVAARLTETEPSPALLLSELKYAELFISGKWKGSVDISNHHDWYVPLQMLSSRNGLLYEDPLGLNALIDFEHFLASKPSSRDWAYVTKQAPQTFIKFNWNRVDESVDLVSSKEVIYLSVDVSYPDRKNTAWSTIISAPSNGLVELQERQIIKNEIIKADDGSGQVTASTPEGEQFGTVVLFKPAPFLRYKSVYRLSLDVQATPDGKCNFQQPIKSLLRQYAGQ